MKLIERSLAVVLPLVMLVAFAQVVAAIVIGWTMALMGDMEIIADLVDYDGPDVAPDLWRMGIGMAACAGLIAVLGDTVWNLHRLMRVARKSGLANSAAARAMRRSGRGLIGVWLVVLFLDYGLPVVLFGPGVAEVEWILDVFGPDVLLPIVGGVLIAVSNLSGEAMALRAENESFI